jgi:hypothetical protein
VFLGEISAVIGTLAHTGWYKKYLFPERGYKLKTLRLQAKTSKVFLVDELTSRQVDGHRQNKGCPVWVPFVMILILGMSFSVVHIPRYH